MAFWIVGLVALVAVIALVMRLLKDESVARERVQTHLHDSATPTLEYVVPTGEDPVVVVAALERAGYTVAVDAHGAHQLVIIECPGERELSRGTVRAVIDSAHVRAAADGLPAPAAVRFGDEG
jgi:hypothetical protein